MTVRKVSVWKQPLLKVSILLWAAGAAREWEVRHLSAVGLQRE